MAACDIAHAHIPYLSCFTGDFKSVVLKSRRESAHARTFGGDFELKILRMRGFSSRFWTMDLKSPVACMCPDPMQDVVDLLNHWLQGLYQGIVAMAWH